MVCTPSHLRIENTSRLVHLLCDSVTLYTHHPAAASVAMQRLTKDRAMCPESEGILYTFADSQVQIRLGLGHQ